LDEIEKAGGNNNVAKVYLEFCSEGLPAHRDRESVKHFIERAFVKKIWMNEEMPEPKTLKSILGEDIPPLKVEPKRRRTKSNKEKSSNETKNETKEPEEKKETKNQNTFTDIFGIGSSTQKQQGDQNIFNFESFIQLQPNQPNNQNDQYQYQTDSQNLGMNQMYNQNFNNQNFNNQNFNNQNFNNQYPGQMQTNNQNFRMNQNYNNQYPGQNQFGQMNQNDQMFNINQNRPNKQFSNPNFQVNQGFQTSNINPGMQVNQGFQTSNINHGMNQMYSQNSFNNSNQQKTIN